MEAGRLLGSGLVAEVFEWGTEVIKLYRPGQGKQQAFLEAAILALLEEGPLPTPKVYGVVETGGRWGVVMSRAPGRPMATEMADHPGEAPAMLAAVVDLQIRLHGEPGLHLPRQQDRLRQAIAGAGPLSAAERGAMLARLEQLPDGDRLCHGDFHPFNIMGTPEQPIIVDWLDASQGVPEADACRSYLLLLHNAAEAAPAYLELYVEKSGRSRDAVLAWLPVLAAARLAEQVPAEQERLLALVRAAL